MLTYLLGRQVGKMTAEYLTPDRSDALDEGSAMSNAMLNEQLDEQSLGDDPSILERYAAGDPPADTPPPSSARPHPRRAV